MPFPIYSLFLILKFDYPRLNIFNITYMSLLPEIPMKEKADKPNLKQDLSALRKKTKRIEDSRTLIKAKSREKGNVIKEQQDRQIELAKNRDDWKAKSKEHEKKRIEAEDKYTQVASLLKMKEEQLREILNEFEEFKKKRRLKN